MKILVGDLETKLDEEAVSNLAIWNESSLESNESNGIRVVNIVTSKYLIFKNSRFTY
jgi:hypothetical protein